MELYEKTLYFKRKIMKGFNTRRFKIRKFSLKLINLKYFKWFEDKSVSRFITNKPKNISDLKKRVEIISRKKNTEFYAIYSKKKHIGNFKIHDIDTKKREAWLGILIGDKKFRGKGVASEVIEELITYLLNKNIFFLKLNVHKQNFAAIRAYKKTGFIIEKNYFNYFTMINKLYVKKLILGLAQLQSIYGVTNYKRKTLSTKNSISILKSVESSFISELDTGMNYPFQIKLLKKINKKLLINTKILISEVNNFNIVINHINEINLQKNAKVNILFIHDGNNLLSDDGKRIFKKLHILKKNKQIKGIGVSFHNYKNFAKILNKFPIDVIQIPFNVVDNRAKKFFSLIKSKKIKIQVRSIFLQGSLLKKVKTNRKLSIIYDKIKLNKIIDRITFLLSFALKQINIDKILIGVRHPNELKMILNLPKLDIKTNTKNLSTSDLEVIDPLKWNELHYHETK